MTPRYLWLLGTQAAFLLVISQWVHGAGFPMGKDMKVVYEWIQVDFYWPSKEAREKAIENKEYIPKNVLPFDVDVYKDRTFVTTPRFQPGIPATISTISDKTKNGQHLLAPFPDWETNREGNCNGITSVFHIEIDDLGRLWAIDAGAVNFLSGKPERICTPQILVFDLNAGDKLVARYRIPDSVLDCSSLLFAIQIDVRNGDYPNAFVYVADVFTSKLIVLDLRHESFHRVVHNSFLPDRHKADYNVAGTRVFTVDGIISIALGPVCDSDRRVYYHSLPSLEECYVMASTIQSKAYVTNERAYPDNFYCYGTNRNSQSAPEAITEDGVIFFEQETTNSVNCWNTEIDYNMENTAIVARNDTTMQSIRGLKLVGSELYVVSTRFQLYVLNMLSKKNINFRVLKASVDELIAGTFCVKPCPGNYTDCESHSKDYR